MLGGGNGGGDVVLKVGRGAGGVLGEEVIDIGAGVEADVSGEDGGADVGVDGLGLVDVDLEQTADDVGVFGVGHEADDLGAEGDVVESVAGDGVEPETDVAFEGDTADEGFELLLLEGAGCEEDAEEVNQVGGGGPDEVVGLVFELGDEVEGELDGQVAGFGEQPGVGEEAGAFLGGGEGEVLELFGCDGEEVVAGEVGFDGGEGEFGGAADAFEAKSALFGAVDVRVAGVVEPIVH